MKTVEKRAFVNDREFREYCRIAKVVYFYIYESVPDETTLTTLDNTAGPDEAVVLLDVSTDRGFLHNTTRTVEILRNPLRFVSKPFAETPGVGAWVHGTMVGFAETEAQLAALIRESRRVAFPRGCEKKEDGK